MLGRPILEARLRRALRRSPVTMLLGPRQCGKTTLAGLLSGEARATGPVTAFDLENPRDLAALAQPQTMLESLRGLVVIDEVQRKPDLFPLLRVLADRQPRRTRFLLLGSASPELAHQAGETLAGRVEAIEMGGFTLDEVGGDRLHRLWTRGGFPRSFLARSEEASRTWRDNLVHTFLERDLPNLGLNLPAPTMRRFWTMLAHYHGQTWNASEIGRSLGRSDLTTRRWLDILTGGFVVRQLQPWFENLAKRQVRAPKIYVRDSGILHSLLGVEDRRSLAGHPKFGASFEGLVIEEILRALHPCEAYFWAVHGQGELDLLVFHRGKRLGFEMKCADAPEATTWLESAFDLLGLSELHIIYPGPRAYRSGRRIQVTPFTSLAPMLSAW